MTDFLLACGAVGPVLFILVFLIEGAIRPGYRPWRHFVSLLALGERGWIQVASFLLCGALMFGFTLGVARTLDSAVLPVLFGIFSIALIASGFFPADPALGYPPGTETTWPPVASRTGTVHNLAGLLAFVALPVASFVVAHASDGCWRIYSIVTGVMMPVFFVASAVLAERSARGQLADAPVGVAQRLSIMIGWSWVALLAVHLVRGP